MKRFYSTLFTRKRDSYPYSYICGLEYLKPSKENNFTDKIAIFDIDMTLLKFFTGFETEYENKKLKNIQENVFPEVIDSFNYLRDKNVDIVIASKSPDPLYAMSYIERAFGLSYFDYVIIHGHYNKMYCENNNIIYNKKYETLTKKYHFERIKQITGNEYSQMTLFDDELKNIYIANKLGINASHCKYKEGLKFVDVRHLIK